MKNLIKNNTDLVVVLLTTASIGLTFMRIMDVKDFAGFVLMAFGYKFAKGQKIEAPVKPVEEQLG